MPVKNNSKYIKKCVESILNQTHKNFELIIIDDSIDDTENIIRSINDKRIKFFKFNGNISAALNYGICNSNYDYICRMDGDDFSAPDRIQKQLDFLINHPDINIVGTNYYCIDENNKILFEKKFPEHDDEIKFMMPIITSVLHPTIMFRKKEINSVGNYNGNYEYVEDLDLFLRTSVRFNFYNIQEPLHYYRLYNFKNGLFEINNNLAYKISLDFINKNRLSYTEGKLKFQKGLLEYYKNDVSLAKKYFFSVLFSSDVNLAKVLRYLLPSLMGNNLIKFLRKNNLVQKLNKNFIKMFNYDSNLIKE